MGGYTVYSPPPEALRLLKVQVTAALPVCGFVCGAALVYSTAAAVILATLILSAYGFLMLRYLPAAVAARRVILCENHLILCYGVYYKSRVLVSPHIVISTARTQGLWARRYGLGSLRLRAAGRTFSAGPLHTGDADAILDWVRARGGGEGVREP